MPDQILQLYGIQPDGSKIELFGNGLINHTWKVSTSDAIYILQQINQEVFKHPQLIDQNLKKLKEFLALHYPDYLFVSPLPALSGKTLVHSSKGYFRLFPFIKESRSLSVLNKKEHAFEAAKQFGKFSRLLNNFDVQALAVTLPDFHNLSLRYLQFLDACKTASTDRKEKAKECITFITEQQHIVTTFEQLVSQKTIPLRVIHHDTKISNVLFDNKDQGICVIDLDTVMPGYFISDVGDMMRTYLSAVTEEETDFDQITIRKDYFHAIYAGYMEEMGNVLNLAEKEYFSYAGKFIIYMQAIRFITDYLQNDSYYGSNYDGHNLNRGKNQLSLLKKYMEMEKEMN